MYKVFLVEDETVVREGLRDNIPWEQYGFSYVGDAADGEMAMPLIRELKPELLITDIKMPFMDGLELSALVRRELPDTHIIIISGYNDFIYAQQAISMGIDEYLLKPIKKTQIAEVLENMRDKLDSELEMKQYFLQFRSEAQVYEQYSRRRFFEKLVHGKQSAQDIAREAEALDIRLNARCYNIIMLSLHEPEPAAAERDREEIASVLEGLIEYLTSSPEYVLFRWNLTTYAVLIKGEPESIGRATENCMENIAARCAVSDKAPWYAAAGRPVESLDGLPACFSQASRILSYSYLCPERHILTEDCIDEIRGATPDDMENCAVDPGQIRNFLANGETGEIDEFVSRLLCKVNGNVLNSVLFCQYLRMTVLLTVTRYLESIECDTKELIGQDNVETHPLDNAEATRQYVRDILRTAIERRQTEFSKHYRDVLRQAMGFIDKNYSDNSLSLNCVAKEVNISPNYFSALFSQEVGQTFIEYLTQRRMTEACYLLRQTAMRSSEVASAVGYKDPHYFSFLFKKTQGCTPRDYRGGAKQ